MLLLLCPIGRVFQGGRVKETPSETQYGKSDFSKVTPYSYKLLAQKGDTLLHNSAEMLKGLLHPNWISDIYNFRRLISLC